MLQDGNFLEIGTFDGVAISRLAKQFPKSTFYSVDAFEKGYATDGGHVECVLRNTEGCENFVLIKGRSQTVMRVFGDGCFDVAFIDGDHAYQSVMEDINNCRRVVKSQGKIVLHDFALDTVSRAIHDSKLENGNIVADVMWFCN